MPLRWHVNLPGPVAYSRPVRRKGKKPGLLTSVLVWFIVKPVELLFRSGAHVAGSMRSRSERHWNSTPEAPVATHGYYRPSELGWHDTQFGPLYWSGTNWYDRDGRPLF